MLVSDTSDAFLSKARESLAGATSELANGRHNNAANRAYYACFQAAIAALDLAAVRPPAGKEGWSHAFVQAQFAGVLITRRKVYPPALRDALSRAQQVREQADYARAAVSQAQATRVVARARVLVGAVIAHATGGARA